MYALLGVKVFIASLFSFSETFLIPDHLWQIKQELQMLVLSGPSILTGWIAHQFSKPLFMQTKVQEQIIYTIYAVKQKEESLLYHIC